MRYVTVFLCLCVVAMAVPSPRDVDSWKARFPAAAQTANPVIRQLSSDCAWLVRQSTPGNLQRSVTMARDKANATLATMNERLRSQRGGRSTGRERADAEEAKQWIEGRLLPYLAQGAQLAAK